MTITAGIAMFRTTASETKKEGIQGDRAAVRAPMMIPAKIPHHERVRSRVCSCERSPEPIAKPTRVCEAIARESRRKSGICQADMTTW